MPSSLLVFLSFCALATASPARTKRFDPWDSFNGMSVSTGFGGGFAQAGFFPYPVQIPVYRPFPAPIYPSPYSFPFNYPFSMNFPTPWYKGDNVCVEKKVAEDPQEFKDILSSVDFGPENNFQFGHESEHCRGTNTLYVCRGRTSTNDGGKMYITKYQCCHGFVRAPYGPGCVENPDKEKPSATESSGEKNSGSTKYTFVPIDSGNPVPDSVPVQKR